MPPRQPLGRCHSCPQQRAPRAPGAKRRSSRPRGPFGVGARGLQRRSDLIGGDRVGGVLANDQRHPAVLGRVRRVELACLLNRVAVPAQLQRLDRRSRFAAAKSACPPLPRLRSWCSCPSDCSPKGCNSRRAERHDRPTLGLRRCQVGEGAASPGATDANRPRSSARSIASYTASNAPSALARSQISCPKESRGPVTSSVFRRAMISISR